jgi:hypothetical protein
LEHICGLYADFGWSAGLRSMASTSTSSTGTAGDTTTTPDNMMMMMMSNNHHAACLDYASLLHLMCPNEYEVSKICAAAAATATTTTTTWQDAVHQEFCHATFEDAFSSRVLNLNETMICENLCTSFVIQGACCTIECK